MRCKSKKNYLENCEILLHTLNWLGKNRNFGRFLHQSSSHLSSSTPSCHDLKLWIYLLYPPGSFIKFSSWKVEWINWCFISHAVNTHRQTRNIVQSKPPDMLKKKKQNCTFNIWYILHVSFRWLMFYYFFFFFSLHIFVFG